MRGDISYIGVNINFTPMCFREYPDRYSEGNINC
ncbi:MAG: hypothetical protein JWQ98_1733 [Chlorobi bacterium]|nr:hypothetical protein [Chlorobiota bacterium]